jgi:hypothetical protein
MAPLFYILIGALILAAICHCYQRFRTITHPDPWFNGKRARARCRRPAFTASGNLVRIRDNTRYSELMVSRTWGRYTYEDFAYDLVPYLLELKVEPFSAMFRKDTLTKLGYGSLPDSFLEFYEEFLEKKHSGEELTWLIGGSDMETLAKLGLLEAAETERTEESMTEILETHTVHELRELCEKFGLKKRGLKSELVQRLLEIKDKLPCPKAGKPSEKFYQLIDYLGYSYVKDIGNQLSDKPAAYAAAAWDAVLEDSKAMLPDSTLEQIASLRQEAEKGAI